MENEGKIVELLDDMIIRQDAMVVELREVKGEMVKLNLQTSENSRPVLKLAEELRLVADHERRISKLEQNVFK